ncbi:hypothetical protein M0Q50_03000 [bacterium]|jgi:hypothetical protein|nr:hypothetical protein [bacterium]
MSKIYDLEDYWLDDNLFIEIINLNSNVYISELEKPRLLLSRIKVLINDYVSEFNKSPHFLFINELLAYDLSNNLTFEQSNFYKNSNSINSKCFGYIENIEIYFHNIENTKFILSNEFIFDMDNFIKKYYRQKKLNTLE